MRHEYNNPKTQIFFFVGGELCVSEGPMMAPPANPGGFGGGTLSGSGGSH